MKHFPNFWRSSICFLVSQEIGGYKSTHLHKWVVLDGDIDATWIESMNTVMDDNKVLTLVSNERIPFTPTMRMLLEIQDCLNVLAEKTSFTTCFWVGAVELWWAVKNHCFSLFFLDHLHWFTNRTWSMPVLPQSPAGECSTSTSPSAKLKPLSIHQMNSPKWRVTSKDRCGLEALRGKLAGTDGSSGPKYVLHALHPPVWREHRADAEELRLHLSHFGHWLRPNRDLFVGCPGDDGCCRPSEESYQKSDRTSNS